MHDDTASDPVDALRARIGPEAVAELQCLYVDGARRALDILRAGSAEATEILRLVHDLKSGSALLGQAGAAREAAAVEAALVRQDPAVAELLPDLLAAIEDVLRRLQPSG